MTYMYIWTPVKNNLVIGFTTDCSKAALLVFKFVECDKLL